VAGVVNLLINTRLRGFKGMVQTGATQYGDGRNYLAGLAWGGKIGEKLNLVVGGEWERNDGIKGCEQRDWCAEEWLNWGRNPGDVSQPANNILPEIHPSTVPWNGMTVPTGFTPAGPTLGPLGGITFADDGTPRKFVFGSQVNSLYQIGGEGHGQNIYFGNVYILAPTTRWTTALHSDYEVSPSLKVNLDMNYGHHTGRAVAVAYRNTNIAIKRDNAFIPRSTNPALDIPTILAANPSIQTFGFGKGFQDIGQGHTTAQNDLFRTVLSVEGSLGSNWKYDGYYEYGQNRFRSYTRNNVVTARLMNAIDAVNVNGQIVCRINADAVTTNDDRNCVPLNPFGFGQGPVFQQGVNYVTATTYQTNHTTEHVVSANLKGDLIKLPAGPLQVAFGGEYRSDDVAGDADPISRVNGFFTGGGSLIDGTITVKEAYAEAEVPLLADMPFFKQLSFNGAIRPTHYKREGSGRTSTVKATTWKVGGVWEPTDWLRFRATRSRDTRAPNVAELFGPVTQGNSILTDPVRGGQQTVAPVTGGANANLLPERADTFTVGMVIAPKADGILGRTKFSVDYYDIDIKDAIGTLGGQNVVTRCFQGDPKSCSLITRDSQNVILQIIDTQQNVARLITRGVDFELSYNQPLGAYGGLDVRVLATYVKDLITVDTAGATERAGQTGLRAGTPPGIPDWTVDGLVTWSWNRFSLTGHARYINKGFYNAAFIGPDEPGYSIALGNSTNTNAVPSKLFVDLMAQYRFEYGGGHQLTVYAGGDNIFNVDPPRVPGANGTGNNVLFNPIGRSVKVGARFDF
jgi:outer membrane receptor protein involved in Fe transport